MKKTCYLIRILINPLEIHTMGHPESGIPFV